MHINKYYKLFLQYQYADEGLKCFTKHSGAVLPFDYQMTDTELQALTPFARDVWKLHHSDEVEIVYDNPMMRSKQVRYAMKTFGYSSKINGTEYASALFNNFVTFRQANSNVTIANYIAGMHTYYDGAFTDAFPVK